MDLGALQSAIRRGVRVLFSPPPMSLSQWAARNFYLSAESSYVEQSWRAYPFQVVLLDCMGSDEVREFVFRKSARVGYTKMFLACIGYMAEHKRRNQAIYQPTDEDAREFVKTEIDPMIRDVPAVQAVFPLFRQRNSGNTIRQKMFLGSMLHVRGGRAAREYRRISIDTLYMDELDAFDTDIEGEGNPLMLAGKRVEGATFPKIIVGTTPSTTLLSIVGAREAAAERVYRYHIPCPHCGELHTLAWERMRYDVSDPDGVQHACDVCGALYSQADYLQSWETGVWRAGDGSMVEAGPIFRDTAGNRTAAPRIFAAHTWTAYSPQKSWGDIVRDYQVAETKSRTGDKSLLKTFHNTTLGEAWEEDFEQTDAEMLRQRAETYPQGQVPHGALVLVAGVDVQGDRFEVVVWGIGPGEEMWVVDYQVIHADTSQLENWAQLDAVLAQSWPTAGGGRLRLEAAAIDSGGGATHQCYLFCREREARRIFAVKGQMAPGEPIKLRSKLIDIDWKGKQIKRGVRLWHVGTSTAKDLLHGRLQKTTPGAGCVHFSSALPPGFYSQLCAEVRTTVRIAGREETRWVKRGHRNEVLDCTVYALFCVSYLGLDRYTERQWARLQEAVAPLQSDIFAAAPGNVPEVPAPAVPIPGKISLKGWGGARV